MTAKEEGARTR